MSIFLYQLSYSNIIKVDKELILSENNINYIATIHQPNVKAMAINSDSTKLYSIYYNFGQLCVNITKLSTSISSASTHSNCFDSIDSEENYIVDMLINKFGNAFYLFSKHDITAYNISPISDKIKGRLFNYHIDSDIIQVIPSMNLDSIYVLTSSENSSSGKLLTYKVDKNGQFDKISEEYLNFKPIEMMLGKYNIYISSNKEIYRYNFDLKKDINKSERVVSINDGVLESFDITEDTDTKAKLAIGIRKVDSINNQEYGVYRLYNLDGFVQLQEEESLDRVPVKVVYRVAKEPLILYEKAKLKIIGDRYMSAETLEPLREGTVIALNIRNNMNGYSSNSVIDENVCVMTFCSKFFAVATKKDIYVFSAITT
ncbi:hypothetical protein [Francisella philomiragia]|uniref:hypothetical protein n=1 Tax=Francisella philomiragia TaxID=28110 RepID=UPI001C9E0B35|nr:hypothetical protein [Francisella philomiragia]MBY7733769.1 hypothetical protein [Francisella philomiragia]